MAPAARLLTRLRSHFQLKSESDCVDQIRVGRQDLMTQCPALETSDLRLCFLQMMWFCWVFRFLTSSNQDERQPVSGCGSLLEDGGR